MIFLKNALHMEREYKALKFEVFPTLCSSIVQYYQTTEIYRGPYFLSYDTTLCCIVVPILVLSIYENHNQNHV